MILRNTSRPHEYRPIRNKLLYITCKNYSYIELLVSFEPARLHWTACFSSYENEMQTKEISANVLCLDPYIVRLLPEGFLHVEPGSTCSFEQDVDLKSNKKV